MSLRYATYGVAIPATGLTVAHGLTDPHTGAAATPTEYWVNLRGTVGVFFPATAVDATNVYVTAAAAATADVFAAVVHSLIR